MKKQKQLALNEFFSDAFTEEDTSYIPSFHAEDIRKPLEELKITEEKVKERLESLNPHKSPGPDGLHPRVLKELSNEISKPLAIIMQRSLDEHTLPHNWKDAHVSPIFKKGSKSSVTNYRPISLTSVICGYNISRPLKSVLILYRMRDCCLEKAKGYGIRGDILEWIRLFINGRQQRVVVNGK